MLINFSYAFESDPADHRTSAVEVDPGALLNEDDPESRVVRMAIEEAERNAPLFDGVIGLELDERDLQGLLDAIELEAEQYG